MLIQHLALILASNDNTQKQTAKDLLNSLIWSRVTIIEWRQIIYQLGPNKSGFLAQELLTLQGIWLSAEYVTNADLTEIKDILLAVPDNSGYPINQQELSDWNKMWQSLVDTTASSGKINLTWVENSNSYTYPLQKAVITQLQKLQVFTNKQKINFSQDTMQAESGLHLVVKLELTLAEDVNLYLKFFPEMPGLEYAAGCLARRFNAGTGAPYVKLVKLNVGKDSYPVLLSKTIAGVSLHQASTLSLDVKAFSQRALISFI